MQDQHDNMDDLFRKAADDYPLNVGVPDWNRIAGAIAPEAPALRAVPRYRRFFWLLLLIPFGFVCNYLVNPENQLTVQTDLPQKLKSTVGGAIEDHSPAKLQSDATIKQPETLANKTAVGEKKQQAGSTDHTRGVSSRLNDTVAVSPDGKQNNKQNIKQDNRQNNEQNNDVLPADITGKPGKRGFRDSKTSAKNTDSHLTGFHDYGERMTAASGDRARHNNGRNESDAARPRQQSLTAVQADELSTGLLSTIPLTVTTINESPLVNATGNMLRLSYGQVPGKMIVRNDHRFYIGVAGGADLSSVKLQKIAKPGSQYGGVIGYQFAKRWSVEAGVFFDKKHYYTDGEYFDKRRMTINPSSKILTVDGVCRMYEIPVSIKYDISNNFRSNWFVSAGLSSYIMKEENYDMLYLYTGSGSTSMHNYEYKNSSKNLFSQLRLTAGYSYKLPYNFAIRMEPYLNIPVSGVGYGKLKLNSAGLNLGIFKRLF